jgi:Glyoxalase-like domain
MTDRLKCLIPTIGCPETINGNEGRYELAGFYCKLLDMQIVNEGWLLIAERADDNKFYLAFDRDGWTDQRAPRWPDPEYPQQMHLDIFVPDMASAVEVVTANGATLLRDDGDFAVYADPVGHPFCLYPDSSAQKPTIGRLVFDCFSPRALARFYEGFLGAQKRVEDSPERVVVDLGDGKLPDLAFQHAQFRAARWPDPEYPAQVHVDYRWHDGMTARAGLERAENMGAVRLPQPAGAEIYADPAGHPFCIQNEIPMVFDVVGLYLNPPEYAVAYCVDTTRQLPAPTRSQPTTPMLADMPERPTHHADRDGAAGPLATLDSARRAVANSLERTTAFISFLTEIDAKVPSHLEVNLVCDWDDTYNTPAIQAWLADHARFEVHRNPPDAQWNTQAERWLGYLTNDLGRRGDHASGDALEAELRSWARRWNTHAQTFVWTKATDEILESLQRLVTRAFPESG